jgi:hypothetical protein
LACFFARNVCNFELPLCHHLRLSPQTYVRGDHRF